MSTFRRKDNDEISITFTSQEAHVLINLTEQLIELLADGDSQSHQIDPLLHLIGFAGSELPPEDPVLRRLLPNAYEDAGEAGEFRRYTEHGLREKKKAHAHMIYESLLPQDEDWNGDIPLEKGSIEVSFALSDAMAWLGGLNDLRIALAVRLGFGADKVKPQQEQTADSTDAASKENAALHQRYELMVDSDPMKAVYAVYSWIGWLQQSLLDVL
ncbi:MAG: hypothetical protein RL733_795 [Actinomycetota bacterium]